VLGELSARLAGFDERLEESQRLLARQTELVERLHAENQRLRKGEVRAAQLPLVRDVLRLHDDLGRLVDAAEGDSRKDLEIVRASLLDTLARNGITPFEGEAGEPFDSRRQSVAGVVGADDPALNRLIAETLRAGFAWDDGELIRVADVRVHRHVAPQQDAPTAATEDRG
jgi:molecular chaperone GrpE (heat shock protein)